jgi:hypothetical protein
MISRRFAGIVETSAVRSTFQTFEGALMTGPAKIVVRYANGKTLKGYSHDFSPLARQFYVRRDPLNAQEGGQLVATSELKAVFFVRDFYGDNSLEERKHFVPGKALPGRKVEVTFHDGEVLVGTTTGYEAGRPGFFVFPVDAKSNNVRVFVVMAAAKHVRFL